MGRAGRHATERLVHFEAIGNFERGLLSGLTRALPKPTANYRDAP
jgi:hypothetical protein